MNGAAALVAVAAMLAWPAAGAATYPGAAGVIAFDEHHFCDVARALLMMTSTGRDLRHVGPHGCSEEAAMVWSPSWSGDGTRLLVQYQRAAVPPEDPPPRLAVMGAEGADLQELPWSGEQADLSPDGRQVAFIRFGARHPTIWIGDVESGQSRRVRYGLRPRWSPDGRTIASVGPTTYGRRGWVRGGRISLLRASDGHLIRRIGPSLTRESSCCALEPTESLDWSPDGRRLVYSSYAGATSSNVDLYIQRADGSHRRRLTSTRRRQESRAVWSPDGKRVAFVSTLYPGRDELDPVRYSIWTMPARGGPATKLWAKGPIEEPEGPHPPTLAWQPLARP